MAQGGRIDYTVGFNIDKTGLNVLRTQLNEIKKLLPSDLMKLNPDMDLNTARSKFNELQGMIKEIDVAFKSSFNTITQETNLTKLNQSLKQIDINKLASSFNNAGKVGQQAFYNITKGALTTKLQLKETETILDKIGETLTNTIKWNLSSSLVNKFTNSISQAYSYVQHLDTSLNDIRIVTGKSADEMEKFAVQANKTAQALGRSTTQATEAALIYYQQGLNDEESQARMETTLKAANVTGQSAQAVSEELTAVWNGYKVNTEETEAAVDKLAAVAATTASDLQELSTGMSKVASAANAMGVDMDQLNAQIATIISVTRQAPESVGTALKTIYARLSDLKLGDTDEDGLGLGDVSGTLDKVGIAVLDANGDLREMGDVIEDVAAKWNTWTSAQQTAIAQVMAGKRQYNNLVALFENWDMYSNALETSRNSLGTLQNQQDIYMESTEAHLFKLKAEWEDLYDSLIDNEAINGLIDSVTKLISLFGDFTDAIGGGASLLTNFGGIAMNVFSKQISGELIKIVQNSRDARDNARQIAAQKANTELFKSAINNNDSAGATAIVNAQSQMSQYYDILSNKQIEAATGLAELAGDIAEQQQAWKDNAEAVNNYIHKIAELSDVLTDEEREVLKNYDATETSLDLAKGDSGRSKADIVNSATDKFSTQISGVFGETTGENAPVGALNEVINAYNTLIDTQQKSGETWESSINQNKESFDTLKNKINEIISVLELLQDYGIFDEEQTKQVQKYTRQLQNAQKHIEKFEKGEESAAQVGSSLTKNLSHMEEDFEGVTKAAQDFNDTINNTRRAVESTAPTMKNLDPQDALKDFLKSAAIQDTIQNIVSLTGAVTNLAGGLMSLKNIGNIFNDENLSGSEKFLQILMALGMGFGQVISGISGLSSAWSQLTPTISAGIQAFITSGEAMAAENISLKEQIAARKAKIIQEKEEAAIQAELRAEQTANILMNQEEATSTLEEAAAEQIEAGVSMEAVGADEVQTIAKGGLIKATLAHTKALIAHTAAWIAAHPVLSAGIGLLTGIGIAIGVAVNSHKKEQEALKASNEERIKEIDTRQAERDAIQQNIDKLRELADQYNSATYSKEEFLRKSLATIDGLDAEAQAALNAAKSYEEMTQAIDDYNIRVAQESIEEEKDKQSKALSNAFSEQKGFDLTKDGKIEYEFGSNIQLDSDFKKQIQEVLGEENVKISDHGKEGEKIEFQLDPRDKETIDKIYEITKNTNAPASLKKGIENVKNTEDYKVYEEAQTKIKEESILIAKSQTRSRLQWARSAEDVESAEQEFVKALEGVTSPSDALAEFNKYASGFDNDAIEAYIKDYENKNSLFQAFLKNASIGQISNAGDVANNIDEILKIAKEQGLENYIGNVNPKFWLQYLVGDLDETTKQKIIDELNATKDEILEQSREDFDAGTTSDNLKGILDSAITNSLDVSSEEYKNLEASLQGLKEIYPELTEEIDLFSQKGLVGTEHWIQGIYQLQAAIDKIEFDKLNTKADEARDNLQGMFTEKTRGEKIGYDDRGFEIYDVVETEIIPDDSQFQEAINEILNAEYEIDVEVHADAERDFTQLVSSLEQADSMADKIGEDFIVAADDIRELNQAFPGILQDIEYLGDGTIKLNEDIARSAMAAAADEEAASTQALVTKLQNSADELRAKADVYDSMADIAHEANIGMISDDEAKLKINAEMDEIQVENDKIASQSELDNAALVANDSQEKGSINAANWTESYQEAANASAEFAKRAIANAQAVADNNLGAVRGADFGSTYTGNNVNASEATSSSGIKTNANGGYDWAATEDQFRNMAEAARQEANDIEGMIVAAAAKGTESLKKTGDVGKGSESGSDSGKEADHEEYLEREEDIYHQINQELEQIESTLGRIQKLEDHSWGASAKANLEEENKLLEKQLEKLHEKKALQERDLSSRRGQLEGMGFSFTEDGSVITNADAQLNALYAHYNTMVDTYNAMSAAEQETYKEQLEAEKDRIKKIEDKISQYESTFSDYQSVLDEIMDKHFEQIEKQVQAFNHDIELHLELDEAKEEWNDFWYDIVKDVEDTDFGGQIAKSIDKLKLLVGGFGADVSKSTIAQLTGHLNETITQVRAQIASASRGGADSMFGDDTALSKETLENYMKALMDKLKEAKAEVDNIGENYLKTLDSAQEKIDKQVEAFESINSHLEHNAKLIQMLSGENSFEALNDMYDQQYNNNIRLVETQRANKEFWEQKMASEKAMMESAEKGSKDYKIHAEAFKKASENYRKAINDFDSSVEKTIEDLNKWKDNQLAAINDTFDKALSNGYGLDMVEKEWKLINDQANRYLDNVERALGMESLNNEFNKVLNTTNMSIKAQQELNQMRDEEIAKLNKKVQISQFDLDEVKARLEIRKQEIALEDAQRNKSNLRLRRDSQGNYSYQYTGDDSQIEEASEGLMSAKQAWYDLVKKRNIELADAVLENRKNLQKELQDLETMYFESDEEKRKKQLEIIQRYEDIEKDIMKDAEDAKRIFFDGTAKFFADVEDASILPQWDSTIEKMISSWSSGGKESFTGAVTAGIEQIDFVQTEYVRRTNELLDKAGVDYQNLKNNGIDPVTNSLEEMTSSNEELADSLEEVNRLLEENADKLKEAEERYNDLKDAAVEAGREAERTLEQLAQTAIRTQQQVQASIQATRDMSNSWPKESSSSRKSADGAGTTPSGTSNGSIGFRAWKDERGWSVRVNNSKKGAGTPDYVSNNANDIYEWLKRNGYHSKNGNWSGSWDDKYIPTFKTGGYTGEWGGSTNSNELSSGKLAILHQKELILNESDTSNVLKAVELLRTIAVDKIANSILNAAKASANILANVNTSAVQSMANSITNETDNSYRNMTVNADFSGVRSADAIYEALRNLENVSMQGSF